MGGATVIDFALEHPEAVSALVLVGAGVSGWKDWSPQTSNQFGELMLRGAEGRSNDEKEKSIK
jgi:pimeloyl-ACP methyl ester carboxylesterase